MRPSPGVLLARVWLGRDENGRCVVDCIDSHPPFRRVIAAPGWPHLPGSSTWRGCIWQRRAIACEQVRQLGLNRNWRQDRGPASVEELAELLDGDSAFVRCDGDYEAWLYRDPLRSLGRRRAGRTGACGCAQPRHVGALPPAPPPAPRSSAPRATTRGRSAARKDDQ